MIDLSLFGLRTRISVGFIGMIALTLYIDKTGLMLLSLEAIFLHEAGHLFAMRLLGYRPQNICLKIGAAAISAKFDTSLREELLISLAGPLCNLVFCQIYFALYYYSGIEGLLTRCLIMLVVGCFHLLPIEGLDGGTVLYCLLAGRCGEKTLARLTRIVSLLCCALIFTFGAAVFFQNGQNPSLILLAVYLFIGILLKL